MDTQNHEIILRSYAFFAWLSHSAVRRSANSGAYGLLMPFLDNCRILRYIVRKFNIGAIAKDGLHMEGEGSQTNGGEAGVTPACEPRTPVTRSWPAHVGTPKEITGTENLAAAKWLANQAQACAWPAWYAKPEQQAALSEAAIEASWASMREIGPGDIVQGMLAAQMVAVHGASMGCLEQANRGRQISTVKEFELRLGARLLRTFTQQVEALHRWRGDDRRRNRRRPADPEREEGVGRSRHVAKHG